MTNDSSNDMTECMTDGTTNEGHDQWHDIGQDIGMTDDKRPVARPPSQRRTWKTELTCVSVASILTDKPKSATLATTVRVSPHDLSITLRACVRQQQQRGEGLGLSAHH